MVRSAMFGFVQPTVAHKGTKRGRPCNIESWEAVQKTQLQDVSSKETPKRTKHRFEDREFLPARLLLLQEQVGERIDFRHVTRKRREREVVKVAAQRRYRARANHFLVYDRITTPASGRGTVEPKAKIRIPIAMRDPAIDEPDFARETCAREVASIRLEQKFADGIAQCGGNFFVRVECEHPCLVGQCGGGVLGVTIAGPWEIVHTRAISSGDLRTKIGGVVQPH